MTHFKNNKKGTAPTIQFVLNLYIPIFRSLRFQNEKIKKNKNHTPKIILNPNTNYHIKQILRCKSHLNLLAYLHLYIKCVYIV